MFRPAFATLSVGILKLLLKNKFQFLASKFIHSETNSVPLLLYNQYSREKRKVQIDTRDVVIGNSFDCLVVGRSYICGPTVYDHCHIGHAMAYTRFDIFRRILQEYSNTFLVTVMNITDIDDKIMKKSHDTGKSFKSIGDEYYNSFLDDLKALRIEAPHVLVRVSEHINEIMDYIGKLEQKGYAYYNCETSDINFDTQKMPTFDRGPKMETEKSRGKKSPKDFAIWRCSTSEPLWTYKSPCTGKEILGRPGWHIECSALASLLLGQKVDIHFGGKDLIFPHHYCESACCSAYFNLEQQEVFDWASNWFHSSHVKLSKEKMSKSLGNTISIKQFLQDMDCNMLRLLCCYNHYRTDLEYDNLIVNRIKEIDRRFKGFLLSLNQQLHKISSSELSFLDNSNPRSFLQDQINHSESEIFHGIADDFDLRRGLDSILELMKLWDNAPSKNIFEFVLLRNHISRWTNVMGIKYTTQAESTDDLKSQLAVIKLLDFRENVRLSSIRALKNFKSSPHTAKEDFAKILALCDQVRSDLSKTDFVISDSKTKI